MDEMGVTKKTLIYRLQGGLNRKVWENERDKSSTDLINIVMTLIWSTLHYKECAVPTRYDSTDDSEEGALGQHQF